mmetsp:Transcript_31948/g.51402  ORF Transcript_31948/g.51402 Transcript_31948/m.51402 type:complete len:80 (+) Transcript_31948:133-372(+)
MKELSTGNVFVYKEDGGSRGSISMSMGSAFSRSRNSSKVGDGSLSNANIVDHIVRPPRPSRVSVLGSDRSKSIQGAQGE